MGGCGCGLGACARVRVCARHNGRACVSIFVSICALRRERRRRGCKQLRDGQTNNNNNLEKFEVRFEAFK